MTAIGLDLVFLAPGATGGMETYARALVPELARQRPGVRWVAFCGRELAAELRARPWCDGLEVVELPVSSDTRVRRVAIEQTLLPLRIRRAGVDLVHSLANTAPLARGGPPLVLTVMDVIWARLPETHTGILAKGLAFLVPRAARRAARVIVPSRATATDLERLLDVPADKVDVVPLGPGLHQPAPTPEGELRTRFALGDRPLILCPAPRRPHKNVRRLVEATAGLEATVVVPGYASITEKGLDGAGSARYLGWVSGADMEGLYGAATLLAFPSLAEGFGLPVLEAMRRGLPVACADATSLPEVAGDAALRFDPLDESAIRAAVARLLSDPALREELARRGREQAGRFSWAAAAQGTWAVYDAVLGAGSRTLALLSCPAMSMGARLRTLHDTWRIVREPLRLGVRQTRGANAISRYALRGSGIVIHLRNNMTEDLATLVQTFRQRHYTPPPEVRARLAGLGRAPHAMDLGANIGMFGAWFLGEYPGAKVTAYEADPDNARVHRLTVEANSGSQDWQLHAAAAATRDGEVAFVAGRATNSRLAEPGEDSTNVPAVDVLERAADVDLLKIDIEGAEWELLSDERFADLPACVVALEFHPNRCPSSDPQRAATELLRVAGYRVLEHELAATPGHGMVWGWRTT